MAGLERVGSAPLFPVPGPTVCVRAGGRLAPRGSVRQNIHEKLCEKKPGANLPGVVHHKLWRGQLREPVPHTPVHSGRSPRVVVVAQEVDGLAVLPGDGTQSSPAPEFVPATFGQPPAEFLGVVLAVPAARTPSSFFSRWKSTTEL